MVESTKTKGNLTKKNSIAMCTGIVNNSLWIQQYISGRSGRLGHRKNNIAPHYNRVLNQGLFPETFCFPTNTKGRIKKECIKLNWLRVLQQAIFRV